MGILLMRNTFDGYTPKGRLDTSKPPVGRSGVKSPPPQPQVNVYISDDKKNKNFRKNTDK